MEAALSWLQFPQQDANNIEEKPKVHLETEVREGGRQRSGVALVTWGGVSLGNRNPKSWRHRAVQEGGCTDLCSRTCSLETGRSHVPPPEGGGSGSPVSTLGQGWEVRPHHPAFSSSQGLLWHKALAFT